MKKLYILFSFALLTATASAQKIHYTNKQNKWIVSEPNLAGPPSYINMVTTFDKDSVIGGQSYVHSTWGWFREDTSARIVYHKKEASSPERVLYDYNMMPGDTIIHDGSIQWGDSVFVLHSVDSVQINGTSHVVQYFASVKNPTFAYLGNTVIEGIGQIAQFPFLVGFAVDGFIPLSCFKVGNTAVYIPQLKNGYVMDSRTCTLGITDEQPLQDKVTIAPHPANSTSVITLPTPITGHIRIVNALGQTVMIKDLEAASSIVVGTLLAPGIYFYQITGEAGIAASGRMVYE
ncbi:MAG: T9SS type A sorting domain-containing protein [Sphingobacteriales bacterium]|nr:MAG: T9SS type A sorting domain-containing protein [Sphingobacteriales bacterium]